MTKSQIIVKISKQSKLPTRTVELVLNQLVDTVAECLAKDEKVSIVAFGRFEMRPRKAKKFTNPKTQEKVLLQPSRTPAFRASTLLKERILQSK